MALEWSTDINFAGLFKRKPRNKQEYPSKTYINLIVPDEHEIRGMRLIVTSIFAAIAIGLFAKFGVYDFFARVMEKSRELEERTELLSNMTIQLADYGRVFETYRTYEAARMTDEAEDIAAVDALELVDRRIASAATVKSLSLKDNTLTMGLVDIDLDKVGALVSALYEEKVVTAVRVTTASSATSTNDKNAVTLTISLRSTAAANAEEANAANNAEANAEDASAADSAAANAENANTADSAATSSSDGE